MDPRRLLVCTAIAFSACLAAFAVTASALTNSQGDRYRGYGNDNGTRAYISGSGHTNSTGKVLASVSLQSAPPNQSVAAGIQIGEIKTTAGSGNDCGDGITAAFVETVVNYNTFVCHKTNSISQFGSGGLFAVALSPSGGWETFWNSNLFYGPINLGFSSGYSVSRAEAAWATATPSYSVTWGPSGKTAWQYKAASIGYTTVGTSYAVNQNDDWRLGGTPSPFTISFVG